MKRILAAKWWTVLPVFLLGGLASGLADPQLGRLVQQLGVKPGLATAASVNLLLPLLAISLCVVHPRLITAWLGAVGMTAAYILGLAINYLPAPQWDAVTFLQAVPPVLVAACLGYAVLGTVAALITRHVRVAK